MLLASQVVQSIGNISLVRFFYYSHDIDGITPEHFSSSLSTSVRVLSSWVKKAAYLLQEQWPRQPEKLFDKDGTDYYQRFVIHHDNQSYPCYSLACSYILIRNDPIITDNKKLPSHTSYDATKAIVLGHGRLTECYETAGGNAAAVTYILIDPKHRGNGYGKLIMCLLEREALLIKRTTRM